jgi:hypothetical protein
MIPTAEEFFFDYSIDNEYDNLSVNCKQEISYKAIEFAKLHVEAALEASANQYYPRDKENFELIAEKFLNAYPLTNIK